MNTTDASEEKKSLGDLANAVLDLAPPDRQKWSIRNFLNSMGGVLEECGVTVPQGLKKTISPGAWALFSRLYTIAVRNNADHPRIYCPQCKQWYHVPMYAHCPRHPDSPSIEAEVDVAPLEKNSIAAGMKILDKFMPTLASMSQNISVQGTITTVSAQLVKIIYEFVPPADRKQCMERIDELLSVVQKGDGDRPEQGPDQPSS